MLAPSSCVAGDASGSDLRRGPSWGTPPGASAPPAVWINKPEEAMLSS
jgi:hypothetical protein